MHLPGCLVALLEIVLTSFQDNFIQRQELWSFLCGNRIRWKLGKIQPIFTGADFIQNFTQTVYVSLDAAGALGWKITLGADKRLISANVRYQSEVSELGSAVDKDGIGQLDVAMD